MFSEEFIQDYENYGKDSTACKHAMEQLKKSIEFEKSRKLTRELETSRKELVERIREQEAKITAIKFIIGTEDNLSVSTRKELISILDKLEKTTEKDKKKLDDLIKTMKKEHYDDHRLSELISFFF